MGFLKNIPKEKRKKFAHILAGIVILIHAYEKWEHHSGTWWVFFFFGLLVFTLVVFHNRIHHRFPGIDAGFFLIEGVLMFVTSYYYFSHDKKLLPYCYLLVGVAYIVMSFVRFKKKQAHGHTA